MCVGLQVLPVFSALHLRRCSVAWSNRPCPCWEWRMKARSMPAQNSLLPLDTHMCQRLRQCVNPLPEQMTILPNHQPRNTKPLPGTSIFFVVNNHKALRPGAAPGINAYAPCDACEAFISKTGRARPLHFGTPVVSSCERKSCPRVAASNFATPDPLPSPPTAGACNRDLGSPSSVTG